MFYKKFPNQSLTLQFLKIFVTQEPLERRRLDLQCQMSPNFYLVQCYLKNFLFISLFYRPAIFTMKTMFNQPYATRLVSRKIVISQNV